MRSIHSGTACGALLAALAIASTCRGGGAITGSVLLLLSRDQDPLWPEAAFQLHLDVDIPGPPAVESVLVHFGGGDIVWLEWQNGDGEWSVTLGYPDLESLTSTAHGEWSIWISGPEPSVSTFTLEAAELGQPHFFACPQIVSPVDGAIDVASGAIAEWLPPTSGPLPALFVNPWLDYLSVDRERFVYAGPSALLGSSALSWDPPECLPTGFLVKLGLGYIVLIDGDLITPLQVEFGRVSWEPSPFAPPGYPEGAPLVALAGQTRIYFEVTGAPAASSDFDCNGVVDGSDLGTLLGEWGDCADRREPCIADLNRNGTVDGDDLGTLLGDWG